MPQSFRLFPGVSGGTPSVGQALDNSLLIYGDTSEVQMNHSVCNTSTDRNYCGGKFGNDGVIIAINNAINVLNQKAFVHATKVMQIKKLIKSSTGRLYALASAGTSIPYSLVIFEFDNMLNILNSVEFTGNNFITGDDLTIGLDNSLYVCGYISKTGEYSDRRAAMFKMDLELAGVVAMTNGRQYTRGTYIIPATNSGVIVAEQFFHKDSGIGAPVWATIRKLNSDLTGSTQGNIGYTTTWNEPKYIPKGLSRHSDGTFAFNIEKQSGNFDSSYGVYDNSFNKVAASQANLLSADLIPKSTSLLFTENKKIIDCGEVSGINAGNMMIATAGIGTLSPPSVNVISPKQYLELWGNSLETVLGVSYADYEDSALMTGYSESIGTPSKGVILGRASFVKVANGAIGASGLTVVNDRPNYTSGPIFSLDIDNVNTAWGYTTAEAITVTNPAPVVANTINLSNSTYPLTLA